MLNLKNIRKDYVTSSETVRALRGVSLSFRKNEFVSILGPSGCGKTTLLNIIGGLDQYTDGDLVISGRSTKSFNDRDWDVYRNHRVGFIFQSYNLIPHQTVLGNVEIALTIAGLSRKERIKRAKEALDRVGLSAQYHKRPNQLSGGQCQRVAIARALVNNPEILLADEPTGALDTVTSVQIMELIKEISGERLVIMVTHNPELAEQYSSRIIRLVDGEVKEDSNPFTEAQELVEREEIKRQKFENELKEIDEAMSSKHPKRALKQIKKKRKPKKHERAKMSFFTAFMLSLKNLFTKKGRTTLTAFAGSIGIIGIALILAVSQGMSSYINYVQESTLSAYPITLESTAVDISELINSILGGGGSDNEHENDGVYKDPLIGELVTSLSKIEASTNDLKTLKVYIENELNNSESELSQAISGISYAYDINIPIYTKNPNGDIIKSDTNELMAEMLAEFMMGIATGDSASQLQGSTSSSGGMSSLMMGSMMGTQMWEELLPGIADENGDRPLINDLIYDQYELVSGVEGNRWPEAMNEVVLVLNSKHELDDLTLYALGLLSKEELDAIIDEAVDAMNSIKDNSSSEESPEEEADEPLRKWEYEEILALNFKTILPYNFYQATKDNANIYEDCSDDEFMLDILYPEGLDLKVVGIIKPKETASTTMLSGKICYTYKLTEHIITEAVKSDVVMAQLANPDYDILTGLPFKSSTGKLSDAEKKTEFLSYIETLSTEEKAKVYVEIQCLKAIDASLDMRVNMMMFMMKDHDTVVNMIVSSLEQSSNVNPDSIRSYLDKLTLDELKEMIRPSIEEMVKEQIRKETESKFSDPAEMKAAQLTAELDAATDENFATYYDEITEFSTMTYDEVLVEIGCVDLDSPSKINLFSASFEQRDVILAAIDKYNQDVPKEKQIAYTDYLGIMMGAITTIIDAITYVLIAFVAISLVVSSIMIGVITLISVQERTKEIGVLRAIGASKRDVSSMFNAETIIIGLFSGLLGVGVTYLLCIPINLILHAVTGIPNLNAILPIGGALILVGISVLLTLISGIIPSASAAKKDPVVALRTE